jgi:hypothetical protein
MFDRLVIFEELGTDASQRDHRAAVRPTFESPKPAVFIMAATTGPEIASVVPDLAEVRRYSQ